MLARCRFVHRRFLPARRGGEGIRTTKGARLVPFLMPTLRCLARTVKRAWKSRKCAPCSGTLLPTAFVSERFARLSGWTSRCADAQRVFRWLSVYQWLVGPLVGAGALRARRVGSYQKPPSAASRRTAAGPGVFQALEPTGPAPSPTAPCASPPFPGGRGGFVRL